MNELVGYDRIHLMILIDECLRQKDVPPLHLIVDTLIAHGYHRGGR